MQLGGGCASGTLYTAGGGNMRMFVTFFFFIMGSAVGVMHLPWWPEQPNIGSISLIETLGWGPAFAISLAAFGGIWTATTVIEKRRYGTLLVGGVPERCGWRRALQGPWPLVAGAVALALGNFATLYLAGRPWGALPHLRYGAPKYSSWREPTSHPGVIGRTRPARQYCIKAYSAM
jgi:hypothetical protein